MTETVRAQLAEVADAYAAMEIDWLANDHRFEDAVAATENDWAEKQRDVVEGLFDVDRRVAAAAAVCIRNAYYDREELRDEKGRLSRGLIGVVNDQSWGASEAADVLGALGRRAFPALVEGAAEGVRGIENVAPRLHPVDDELRAAVVVAARDPRAAVRRFAIECMTWMGGKAAFEAELRTLQHDPVDSIGVEATLLLNSTTPRQNERDRGR